MHENDIQNGTTVRIYGIPIEKIHNKDLGPILEQDPEYPFLGIVYCGYGVGPNELRVGTDQLWYFKKSAIMKQGTVDGFQLNSTAVYFYELELTAEIYKKTFRKIELSAELLGPGIFASSVGTPPRHTVDVTHLAIMSRDELQALVDSTIKYGPSHQDNTTATSASCDTWRQTYTETRYDPYSKSDPWGADCD